MTLWDALMTLRAHVDLHAKNIVIRERLLGPTTLWRRHGEPTLAGSAPHIDEEVFGPGSLAWEVLLHPAITGVQSATQFILQLANKPVFAGVQDNDPGSAKGACLTPQLYRNLP
ncbi:MAG: hypothetical protein ABGX08_01515 [Citromicrobium sp.]